MSYESNLNFSGFTISTDGKQILDALYKRESMSWFNSDYLNVIHVPTLSSSATIDSEALGVLTLLCLLAGSKAVPMPSVVDGILSTAYETAVEVYADTLVDVIIAGRNVSVKQRRAFKEKIDKVVLKINPDNIPYMSKHDLDDGWFRAKFETPNVTEIQRDLLMRILKDKGLSPSKVLGCVATLYGYSSFMYRESNQGFAVNPTYKKGLISNLNLDGEELVTMRGGEVRPLKEYRLPMNQHFRMAAWGKMDEVEKFVGLNHRTLCRYLKLLRQMDIIRSLVVFNGKTKLSIDFTCYNNYGLFHYFNNRNRKRGDNKVVELWCYGTKFENL